MKIVFLISILGVLEDVSLFDVYIEEFFLEYELVNVYIKLKFIMFEQKKVMKDILNDIDDIFLFDLFLIEDFKDEFVDVEDKCKKQLINQVVWMKYLLLNMFSQS